MNDRHRRVMRNMKRDNHDEYVRIIVVGKIARGIKSTVEGAYRGVISFFKVKCKPIKWHKANKRWK